MPRNDDWMDDDEEPSARDVAEFGYSSPYDDDPLTIGTIPGLKRRGFWTKTRVIMAVIALILVASFLLADLAPLLR
jgi:hypothetical protein